ncbi:type I methionyl aminopeptidase [Siphonobacter aquaeclarae]|jgi:methionyl aminopeptidase|uniref:Methionine aminopeptidase n=1 Tax=Siphonobacter aquaeclarae TaxID=563176 RepID=A0A1G9N599_9BACT|nr:type I methionyl aminopeptidase [Siphonobacter aquaeclarae]MBO9639685.1 type I methionyl aminopeptidase [Siphonobacter aquaeclarae]SDL81574.1 methionine aminopeptidase, type I [Siphonobacter aquaeclarae]
MLYLKTDEEIELIRISAQVLGKAHAEVAKRIEPGVATKELDRVADEFIRDHKGQPSFKGYNGFPSALCISVNDVVVHGFPSGYRLKEGDIISVDCGVLLNGFHSDSAFTYPVGEIQPEVKALLKRTYESLYQGIGKAVAGNRIGDIGFAVQSYVEQAGYGVVRELVGHGVGKFLHESPEVPNYGRRGQGPVLKEGMTLAIEPMITLGKRSVVQERDGWTIRTTDRKPAAHFEHTVAVRKGKAEILTTFEYIEQVLADRSMAIA